MKKLVTVRIPGTVNLAVVSPRVEGLGSIQVGAVEVAMPTVVTLHIPLWLEGAEGLSVVRSQAHEVLQAAIDGGLKVFINPYNNDALRTCLAKPSRLLTPLASVEVELDVWGVDVVAIKDWAEPEVAAPELVPCDTCGDTVPAASRLDCEDCFVPSAVLEPIVEEGCDCPYCNGMSGLHKPRPSAVLEVAAPSHPGPARGADVDLWRCRGCAGEVTTGVGGPSCQRAGPMVFLGTVEEVVEDEPEVAAPIEAELVTRQEFWVVHTLYADGTWRGLGMCVDDPRGCPKLFFDEFQAGRWIEGNGLTGRRVVRIVLEMPALGAALGVVGVAS